MQIGESCSEFLLLLTPFLLKLPLALLFQQQFPIQDPGHFRRAKLPIWWNLSYSVVSHA